MQTTQGNRMNKKDIIDAYVKIRLTDNTIPNSVLEIMKNSAIEKLESIEKYERNKSIITDMAHKLMPEDGGTLKDYEALINESFFDLLKEFNITLIPTKTFIEDIGSLMVESLSVIERNTSNSLWFQHKLVLNSQKILLCTCDKFSPIRKYQRKFGVKI